MLSRPGLQGLVVCPGSQATGSSRLYCVMPHVRSNVQICCATWRLSRADLPVVANTNIV